MVKNEEKLRKTVQASFMVLETAADPVVVKEAHNLEAAVKALLALNEKENLADKIKQDAENAKSFDHQLVGKYGLIAARAIELGIIAYLGAKCYFGF